MSKLFKHLHCLCSYPSTLTCKRVLVTGDAEHEKFLYPPVTLTFLCPADLIYSYICICRKLIEYFISFLTLWEMGLFNLGAGEMAAPSESLSSLMYKLQCDLMKVIFFLPAAQHIP